MQLEETAFAPSPLRFAGSGSPSPNTSGSHTRNGSPAGVGVGVKRHRKRRARAGTTTNTNSIEVAPYSGTTAPAESLSRSELRSTDADTTSELPRGADRAEIRTQVGGRSCCAGRNDNYDGDSASSSFMERSSSGSWVPTKSQPSISPSYGGAKSRSSSTSTTTRRTERSQLRSRSASPMLAARRSRAACCGCGDAPPDVASKFAIKPEDVASEHRRRLSIDSDEKDAATLYQPAQSSFPLPPTFPFSDDLTRNAQVMTTSTGKAMLDSASRPPFMVEHQTTVQPQTTFQAPSFSNIPFSTRPQSYETTIVPAVATMPSSSTQQIVTHIDQDARFGDQRAAERWLTSSSPGRSLTPPPLPLRAQLQHENRFIGSQASYSAPALNTTTLYASQPLRPPDNHLIAQPPSSSLIRSTTPPPGPVHSQPIDGRVPGPFPSFGPTQIHNLPERSFDAQPQHQQPRPLEPNFLAPHFSFNANAGQQTSTAYSTQISRPSEHQTTEHAQTSYQSAAITPPPVTIQQPLAGNFLAAHSSFASATATHMPTGIVSQHQQASEAQSVRQWQTSMTEQAIPPPSPRAEQRPMQLTAVPTESHSVEPTTVSSAVEHHTTESLGATTWTEVQASGSQSLANAVVSQTMPTQSHSEPIQRSIIEGIATAPTISTQNISTDHGHIASQPLMSNVQGVNVESGLTSALSTGRPLSLPGTPRDSGVQRISQTASQEINRDSPRADITSYNASQSLVRTASVTFNEQTATHTVSTEAPATYAVHSQPLTSNVQSTSTIVPEPMISSQVTSAYAQELTTVAGLEDEKGHDSSHGASRDQSTATGSFMRSSHFATSSGARFRSASQPVQSSSHAAKNERSESGAQHREYSVDLGPRSRIISHTVGERQLVDQYSVSQNVFEIEGEPLDLKARFGADNIGRDEHGEYVMKRIEVPVIEERVVEVKKTERREKLVELKVPKIEYKEVIVEKPETQYVDKVREIEVPETKVVLKPVKQIVDRPVEVIKEVSVPKIVEKEETREVPGEVIEVPKKFIVNRPVIVPKYIDRKVPTVIAQSFWPIVKEAEPDSDLVVNVECRVINFVSIPVPITVPLPVPRPLIFERAETKHKEVLTHLLPDEQYNALIRTLNPSLSLDNAMDLFRFVPAEKVAQLKAEWYDLGDSRVLPLTSGAGCQMVDVKPDMVRVPDISRDSVATAASYSQLPHPTSPTVFSPSPMARTSGPTLASLNNLHLVRGESSTITSRSVTEDTPKATVLTAGGSEKESEMHEKKGDALMRSKFPPDVHLGPQLTLYWQNSTSHFRAPPSDAQSLSDGFCSVASESVGTSVKSRGRQPVRRRSQNGSRSRSPAGQVESSTQQPLKAKKLVNSAQERLASLLAWADECESVCKTLSSSGVTNGHSDNASEATVSMSSSSTTSPQVCTSLKESKEDVSRSGKKRTSKQAKPVYWNVSRASQKA